MAAGTSGGRGGGGGSGISAAEKQAQEFDKARKALAGLVSKYDEGVAEAEKLRDAQITVNDAINAGVITTDQGQQVMADYIESLRDAENPMQKIADTMRTSLGDAFMSIVDGSKSAGDAFKDMARLVLKQAFELLVIKPILDGLFGGKGSSGGGLLGGLLGFANGGAFQGGKQLTAFADGGVVGSPTVFPMANGAGLMGEAGPEAIMPLKRGKNGKLGVQTEGAAQQPVVINQSFNFQANGDDSVKRIIAQEAPKIAQLTQKQILDQRARGGAFRTTFGS
jgi:phage-related minor tail protein